AGDDRLPEDADRLRPVARCTRRAGPGSAEGARAPGHRKPEAAPRAAEVAAGLAARVRRAPSGSARTRPLASHVVIGVVHEYLRLRPRHGLQVEDLFHELRERHVGCVPLSVVSLVFTSTITSASPKDAPTPSMITSSPPRKMRSLSLRNAQMLSMSACTLMSSFFATNTSIIAAIWPSSQYIGMTSPQMRAYMVTSTVKQR